MRNRYAFSGKFGLGPRRQRVIKRLLFMAVAYVNKVCFLAMCQHVRFELWSDPGEGTYGGKPDIAIHISNAQFGIDFSEKVSTVRSATIYVISLLVSYAPARTVELQELGNQNDMCEIPDKTYALTLMRPQCKIPCNNLDANGINGINPSDMLSPRQAHGISSRR